jgi:hypothetical protein
MPPKQDDKAVPVADPEAKVRMQSGDLQCVYVIDIFSLLCVQVIPKVNKDIHKNAAEGNIDLLKEIVKDGTDINVKDSFGCSALVWAIRNGKLDTGE